MTRRVAWERLDERISKDVASTSMHIHASNELSLIRGCEADVGRSGAHILQRNSWNEDKG